MIHMNKILNLIVEPLNINRNKNTKDYKTTFVLHPYKWILSY